MRIPISILISTIPSLGMLSGLTASFTVATFLIIMILKYKNYITFNFKDFKLETIFLIWCFICCIITPNPLKSIITFTEVFILIGFGLLLKNDTISLKLSQVNIHKSLFIGILIAIVTFLIEYFSHGLIYQNFRSVFQSSSSNIFMLPSLDRGCALLSLSSWILIGLFLNKNQYTLAYCFYALILSILYLSDSLAGFTGFILAGLLILISKLGPIKIFRFATIVILIGSTLVPIIISKTDPYVISHKFDRILPDSAKHRLFIWHFVCKKVILKPITGWGFGASRQYEVSSDEVVSFKNYTWSPLPLHPHNNILQILFETGVIGLILFLSLLFKYLNKAEKLVRVNMALGSASYACLVNYYIIGMISYSVWQTWWVATGIWLSIMFKWVISVDRIDRNLSNTSSR